MNVGTWCEAFFTNAKARILAHGFVLAGEDQHEVWMLPGNEELLLSHLNRYIITEDVAFDSITATSAAIAVVGAIPDMLSDGMPSESGGWADVVVDTAPVRCLLCHWAGQPVLLISGAIEHIRSLRLKIPEIIQSGEMADFERLRIQERFPLIGRDLSDVHLAPEAARNQSAICYTKGCYLGQEPIARIDAVGQVNRVLASVEIRGESDHSGLANELSSFDDTVSPAVGLAVIKADCVRSGSAVVRTNDGHVFSAAVSQPATLTGDGTR